MSDDAIAREIAQLRADFKEDFGELRAQLGALLSREVYDAHRDAIGRRMDTLERDVEKIEADRIGEARQVEKDRTASRRWAISSVVFPLLSIIASVIFAVVKL